MSSDYVANLSNLHDRFNLAWDNSNLLLVYGRITINHLDLIKSIGGGGGGGGWYSTVR